MPYGHPGMLVFYYLDLKKIKINLHIVVVDENLIRKCRIPVGILMAVGFVGAVYVFRNNQYIQVVYGFVREWKRGIYLLTATGSTWTDFLMTSTVGNFGWLDTPMLFSVVIVIFVVLAFVSLLRSDRNVEYKLDRKDRIVVLMTFILLCILITMSLANHTIKVILFGSEQSSMTYEIREALYQIPYIGGLQGRYYLPFVSLLFIAIPECVKVDERKKRLVLGALEIVMYIYVFGLLVNRFWIA